MNKILKNILFAIIILFQIIGISKIVKATDNSDAIKYSVNVSTLKYSDENNEENSITTYSEIGDTDDSNSFIYAFNNKTLPDIYITTFLFDGVDAVKKYDLEDGEDAVEELSCTVININTTGNIEFTGTATKTMISVNTNDITGEINLILNNVNITSKNTTPVVYIYNKDIEYDGCTVTIKTVEGSTNYLTGGRLKKVSLMDKTDLDSYRNKSSYISDTSNDWYYGVYSNEEIENILFAKLTADQEGLADGDPVYFYKGSGVISSDIDLNFEGEGFLSITSTKKEGIECKGDINFIGGTGDYEIYSLDDCINAQTTGTNIYINVNSLLASVLEDAEKGDAIDSNGTITIAGGNIYAFACGSSEDSGLDSDNGTYINGGTVIAIGNMSDSISNQSTQQYLYTNFREKQEANTLVVLTKEDGSVVFAFKSDRNFSSLLYSSSDINQNISYNLYTGGTIVGEEKNGLYTSIESYEVGTLQEWNNQTGNEPPSGNGNNPPEQSGVENGNLTYKNLDDGTILISGFEIGTRISDILNKDFVKNYEVKILDNQNNDVSEYTDKNIATGYKIELYNNNELEKTYVIVIYGDVNGDSSISAVDALTVIKNKLELITLTNEAQIEAGRITTDSRKNSLVPSSVDALSIIKYKLEPENYPIDQKMIQNINEQFGEISEIDIHGALSISGTNIVDKNGDIYQLKGVSTHGVAWYPQYVNKETFEYMKNEWEINVVRLAMYSSSNAGYSRDNWTIVQNGVDYATEVGIYAIIDWHILDDGNPNTNKDEAIEFFKAMATKYKDNVNVLYEICNEPNGDVTWERDIKPYAEEVIAEIRKIDTDAIIICGTPTWSQDVDIVSQSPITDYDNIAYSLHFYAATHKEDLRSKLKTALNNNLPIFVSEFGICDASGNGTIDETEANTWIDLLNQNNISWVCWNLSNKDEASSILSSSTTKITDWTEDDLSETGKWLVNTLK